MKFSAQLAALPVFASLALGTSVMPATAQAALDYNEETHLIFMREEEKLARDVYLTLSNMYPNAPIFFQIGDGAEQTHTDTMASKIAQFGLTDPNPNTNNLPGSIGIFTGADYGWYFTEKYNYLITAGAQSELDALYIGAFIEELDMHDIVMCPTVITETKGIPEDQCGLNYTDENPLINSYGSLLSGSESHLRSYVGQIEAIIGVGNYQAQYLPQTTVDEILGR